MDWQRIEKMREMAEKAEKYSKHFGALEKFQKNQQHLDKIERQINESINQEKHLEILNRGILPLQDSRTDLMLEKNHPRRDLLSMESERINLINEQMRLRENPDLHRFTARERFEYQTARYERIADHLKSSSLMPKDLLNAIDYGASIVDRNFKSLGVNEQILNKTRGLGDENLNTLGIDDNFKKIGLADDFFKKIEAANSKSQMLTREESKIFGRSLGEPNFNLQDDLVKSRGFINDYQKAFFNHSSSLEKRLNHIRDADRSLDVAGRNWERQIKRLSETDDLLYRRNTIEAAAVWQFGTEIIIDSLSRSKYLEDILLSHRLLEFNDEYSKFARRTINRIQNGSKTDREAYEKSLEMAETEASIISSTISEIIDASGVNLSETSSDLLQTPVRSNIFVVQRYELKLQGRQTDEAKELGLLDFRVINDLCFKTANCLALIAECNTAAKLIGKDEIFTPTSNTLYAGAKLATILANDKEMFGVVVNFLHILLYESAGSTNLRFDEQKGGYLPLTPDCKIVFVIKFLRNKFYFHEQKGNPRQQQKDWNDIRDSFTHLGLPHYPTKPDEFREMQLTTIIEVEKFLEKLLAAINSKADEHFATKSEES